MTSKLVCKHCNSRYTRSKNRTYGRTFCSMRCYWGGQAITVDEIYKRDRGICHLCEKWVARADASRDHVKPRHDGGRTTWENIKLAHRDCNSRRGHRPVKEYIKWWEDTMAEKESKKNDKQ